MHKKSNTVKYLFVLFAVLLFFLIYRNQDGFTRTFKLNMEKSFSEMTYSDVTIEGISGNPFRKIFFSGLSFDFGKYKFVFDAASLEYSLFDLMTGRTPKSGISETVMSLDRGSLASDDNIIISNRIKGKIRLRQGMIVLDSIDLESFGQIHNSIDGRITTEDNDYRMEISYEARPVFAGEDFIFREIKALVTGPLDNLTIRGRISKKGTPDIHFRAYSIRDQGLINIGSRFGVEKDSAYINHLLSVDAKIKPSSKTFSAVILPNDGKIVSEGGYDAPGLLYAEVENHQLNIFGQDFSNILNLKAEVVFSQNLLSHLLVDIDTAASVVNYQPISEIEASFRMDAERIRAVYIKLGDMALASGFFDIKPPRKLELNINFTNFILQSLLDVLIENRPDLSGRVSGRIDIHGFLSSLNIDVDATAYDGNLGDIDYERIIINADGTWPHLRIYDSRITHKDSSLILDGDLNMERFGTNRFMEDIVITAADNTIIWDGWDITRIDEGRELLLLRALSSGFRVGYKRRITDETRYEPFDQKNEVRLEYDILDDDSMLEFRAKESEEFLGIRKKYKF
jgi:hypothetical protein